MGQDVFNAVDETNVVAGDEDVVHINPEDDNICPFVLNEHGVVIFRLSESMKDQSMSQFSKPLRTCVF